MESTFIWVLVFAGAIIALLATFLIASERELKIKRREVEGLTARLPANQGESGLVAMPDGAVADPAVSAELVAKNRELLAELALLRDQVDSTRATSEELDTVRHQLDAARLELQTLRAERGQLDGTVGDLNGRFEGGDSSSGNLAGQCQDRGDGDNEVRLRAEITELRETLERAQTRLHELAGLEERLVEAESCTAVFKEEQQILSRQMLELKNELAKAHDSLRDFGLTQNRLREMEAMYQEMRSHKSALEEELSRLQNRLGQSEQKQRIIETLGQSFAELSAKQAALNDENLKFQEEFVGLANLFDQALGIEGGCKPAPAKDGSERRDADQPERQVRS